MAVPHGPGIDVRFDEQLSTPQRLAMRLEANKRVAVNKLIRNKKKKKIWKIDVVSVVVRGPVNGARV